MTFIIRLFFLTLLSCSFSTTAKYNEAMCILYKQQMQQFSDDKSSRSYRNARRDFNKNCSNPPPVENKPQQTITEPAPVIKSQSTQQNKDTSNDLNNVNEQSAVEDTLSINETVNPLDEIDTPAQSKLKLSESDIKETKTVADQNPLVEVDNEQERKSNAQETPIESQPKPAIKAANVQTSTAATPAIASPVIAASGQSTSLTTPMLIIVLVLLIAGLVIYKLRIKKQSADSPTTLTSNAVVTPATMPTQQDSQPTPLSDSKTDMGALNTDAAASEKELPIEQDIDEPNAHTVKPEVVNTPSVDSTEQLEADTADDELNEYSEREIEPIAPVTHDEPNYEPADESPMSRIKNEHDFKEPEVRTFDPDAPLPGQKKESPAQVLVEKTPIDTLKEDSPADLADATQEHSREHSSHQDALDQKLPEQTFEQPENINTEEHEIEQALNTLNTQIAEQDSSSTSADETPEKQVKANPFANLSLDPTWDPNTKEKPTIEPKKAVPKSAELIAAEERAKQLKTDE